MSHVGVICSPETVNLLVPILKDYGFVVEALYTADSSATILAAANHDIHFAAPSPDEVLLRKHVELIIITGLPHLHSQVAVKSLGIGKHVVCDNPVGLNSEESQRMVQSAQYYPQLISMVGFGLKQIDLFQELHRHLSSNLIGQPSFIEVHVTCSSLIQDAYDWLCESTMGGGVLNVIGTHYIDLLMHLLNLKICRVHGTLRNFQQHRRFHGIYRTNAEDYCQLSFECDAGVLVTLTIHSCPLNVEYKQQVKAISSTGELLISDHCLYYNANGNKPTLLYEDKSWQSAQSQTKDILFLFFATSLSKLRQSLSSCNANSPSSFESSDERIASSDKHKASAETWKRGPLSEAASFVEASRVRTVVDALNRSNYESRWLPVDV